MSDTAVVTFGKYNVFSAGHVLVVETLAKEAKKRNADMRIYLSHDVKPIPYKEKLAWARKSVPKYARNIIESRAKNIFDVLVDVYDAGYKNIVMVVGGDRINEFSKLLPKYNGQKARHGFYEFDDIKVVSAGARDDSADDVTGMSSTKLRNAAAEGDKELFYSGISQELSDRDKEKYYEVVRKSMNVQSESVISFEELLESAAMGHSTFDVVLKIAPVILTPKTLERITGGSRGIKAWHVTDGPGLRQLLKMQKTRKSIAATTKPTLELLQGLETSGGVVVFVSGQQLFSSSADLFSGRTKEGIRYLQLQGVNNEVVNVMRGVWKKTWTATIKKLRKTIDYSDKKGITEILDEIEDALKQTDAGPRWHISSTGWRMAYAIQSIMRPAFSIDDPIVEYTRQEEKAIGQVMSFAVKTYIDEMEKALRGYKDFLSTELQKTSSVGGWNEVIVNQFEIRKVVGIKDILSPQWQEEIANMPNLKVEMLRGIGQFMDKYGDMFSEETERKNNRLFEEVLQERAENNTPTFLAMIGGLDEPPLFFSPKMWERLKGETKEIETWHVTDAEHLSQVVKIQGKRNTISTTRKLKGLVLAGLGTKGGILLKLRGNMVYESDYDFFSHITKDGIKVKYKNIPMEVSEPLRKVWLSVTKWGSAELFDRLESKENIDEPAVSYFQELLNNLAYEHMTKSSELSKRFSQAPITGPGTHAALTIEKAWRYIYDVMKDKRAQADASISPADAKFIGQVMRKMIQMYLDKTEKILKQNMDAVVNMGYDEQPWDEVLLSNIEIVEGYVLVNIDDSEDKIEDKRQRAIDALEWYNIKIAKDWVPVSSNLEIGKEHVTPLAEETRPEAKKITKKELDQIEKYADKLFAKVGIDVEFTKHFLDRVNDERNKKQISSAELIRLFRETFKKYGKLIPQMGDDAQAVINDMKTDINVPFVLNVQKDGTLDLVNKTVMRKKNFMTSNPKLKLEWTRKMLRLGKDIASL